MTAALSLASGFYSTGTTVGLAIAALVVFAFLFLLMHFRKR